MSSSRKETLVQFRQYEDSRWTRIEKRFYFLLCYCSRCEIVFVAGGDVDALFLGSVDSASKIAVAGNRGGTRE
jgi:hypothetical protein